MNANSEQVLILFIGGDSVFTLRIVSANSDKDILLSTVAYICKLAIKASFCVLMYERDVFLSVTR